MTSENSPSQRRSGIRATDNAGIDPDDRPSGAPENKRTGCVDQPAEALAVMGTAKRRIADIRTPEPLTSSAEPHQCARAAQTRSLAGCENAFALTFAGPPDRSLGSGIRKLRHPTLGWVSLFITPAGRPSTQQRYEVVVDRAPV